jgi:hypothetical protein
LYEYSDYTILETALRATRFSRLSGSGADPGNVQLPDRSNWQHVRHDGATNHYFAYQWELTFEARGKEHPSGQRNLISQERNAWLCWPTDNHGRWRQAGAGSAQAHTIEIFGYQRE